MKKNGFVFIESIVVLMIVALSVTMLMSSYTLIARKTKEKENYDKASDKYLLYAIANLGTDNKCNYGIDCDGDTVMQTTEFAASKENCNSTKMGKILYKCSDVLNDMGIKYIYVVKNIRNTLNDYKRNKDGKAIDSSGNVIKRSATARTGSVNNDEEDLKKVVKIENRAEKAVSIYDNGAIEYMKTLKKCNDKNEEKMENSKKIIYNRNKETYICEDSIMYMIGVFDRGGKLYYASIDISGSVKFEDYAVEIKNGWECTNCNDGVALTSQIWYYYINNVKQKGLQYLVADKDDPNQRKYTYYLDKTTGIMRMGWIKYMGPGEDQDYYHLFSTIDPGRNRYVDGRRLEARQDDFEKVYVIYSGGTTKSYYLNRKGACYRDNRTTPCTSEDVKGTIIGLSWDQGHDSIYMCGEGTGIVCNE